MNAAAYADALRQSAKNRVGLLSELRGLADALKRVPNLEAVLLDAGTKPTKERNRIVTKTLRGIDPVLQNLVASLAAQRQIRDIDQVARSYAAALRRTDGLREVIVESPKRLSVADTKQLLTSLKLKPSSTVVTHRIDPSLIGGLRVVVDDVEHDFSLGGALDRLQYQLTQ